MSKQVRYGAATPEELIDKLLNKDETDEIVITTCPCCNKEFYVLRSDLYAETDPDFDQCNDTNSRSHLTYPKCPHCGYAGQCTYSVNKTNIQDEKFIDPFDTPYMSWEQINTANWDRLENKNK